MVAKLREREQGAKWVSVPCWHNCGGRCVVKALVRDGEILRMKTDDVHEDTWERPQARSCPMGHAMRQQVMGADRLKCPMKRKHWSPEDPHPELRGVDEWERISWDEALDYFANELKAAKEESGNDSILYMNMINLEGYLGQVLSSYGGYVDCTGTQSTGTFGLANAQFGFAELYGSANDRMDLENSDYIVLCGHNAVWCAFGHAPMYLKHAKEKGCKFVFIGPEYSETAGFTNALWIPVRPGTDTALFLGVAYSMLTRDEGESLIDWDFLNRCTVGFDGEHMPPDAKTNESFTDYVLGRSDGIPKTQQWASEICGTPVELIDELADINSCKNNVSFHANSAPARCKGSENYPQMLMTLAAMGGHFGKPGNCAANDQYYGAMNSGIMVHVPYSGTPVRFTNAGNPVKKCVSLDMIWDAIVDGEYWDAGNNFPGCEVHAPVREKLNCRVLISETNNFLSSQANTNKGVEAFRKAGFVFASAYYMKMDAQYADVVVPVTTRWENLQAHLYMGTGMKDKETSYASRAPIPRLAECRTDREIAASVAKRLGMDYEAMNPNSDIQTWFDQIAGTVVMGTDGSATPIASITQEDLDRYGVHGDVRDGIMPLEQYLEEGIYRQERSKDDQWAAPEVQPFAAFRSDPEANPLPTTASGKLEIYCQAKADWFDMVNGYENGGTGIMDFVQPGPLPKHLQAPETYEASFADWDNKVKGEFPIQMTHVHYLRRAHTDCDNLPWLREALVNPVYINSEDARERGIKTGDTVRVWNERGQFLRPASVTRTVMPGVIMVPHGAGARIDHERGIDISGADNILTASSKTTTPFFNSWNSNLVQYEKYEGNIELVPDCEMPQIIPLSE